jgi:hypothetical protein
MVVETEPVGAFGFAVQAGDLPVFVNAVSTLVRQDTSLQPRTKASLSTEISVSYVPPRIVVRLIKRNDASIKGLCLSTPAAYGTAASQ